MGSKYGSSDRSKEKFLKCHKYYCFITKSIFCIKVLQEQIHLKDYGIQWNSTIIENLRLWKKLETQKKQGSQEEGEAKVEEQKKQAENPNNSIVVPNIENPLEEEKIKAQVESTDLTYQNVLTPIKKSQISPYIMNWQFSLLFHHLGSRKKLKKEEGKKEKPRLYGNL